MVPEARAFSAEQDEDNSFPVQSLARLCQLGLLTAPLPEAVGGEGLATEPRQAPTLCRLLQTLGGASLPLGRLYEGHVNAILLISTYGTSEQIREAGSAVQTGSLLGVWNTERGDGLRLLGGRNGGILRGEKVFASGAGYIERPVVTARTPQGQTFMVLPQLPIGKRANLDSWKAHGMRASATGKVDFSGITVSGEQILGGDGDYLREPLFSTGAWRFAAVQAGAAAYVFDLLRGHLSDSRRDSDPHQLARVGTTAIRVESAYQWVEKAACLAADSTLDGDKRIAYVNLARLAVEEASLEVMQLAQRSIGLAGFLRTHPLEQACRDLATYLRQPAPDLALTRAATYVLRSDRPSDLLW
jgi:alkylation response protein AidB-like acyl-CoA dehydrogenase